MNAPANSDQNRYVQSTSINGKPFTKNWISRQDILKGAVFEVKMSDKPNTTKGISEKDFPYSFSNEK